MADMQELIARLEASEAGSRELDALIWAWEQPDSIKVREAINADGYRSQVFFTLPPKRTEMVTKNSGPYRHAEPVTTSLDAALALAERVLPDWRVFGISDERDFQVNSGWGAGICELRGPGIQHARSSTPALALCIAILKAKAQGEGNG